MKKKQVDWKVGDRCADLSYMVDRNDLNEHAKGTITYVPKDPKISGIIVLKDNNKKKGIMHEYQVEYDDLIRLVKKKKPVEKRVAREFWIRPHFIPYHILTCEPSDEGFIRVKEVLDEPSDGAK